MKKIVKFLAITTAVIGVSLASRVSASAKTTYQYSYTCDNGGVPYFTRTAKVSNGGVLWNTKHTKKIGNMEDYPYSRWLVKKVYTKKRNSKVVGYYYYVKNQNNKKQGLVWSGYLNKALAQTPNQFKSDAKYLNYIQKVDSQRLTRAILKLFPNTQVSVKLSSLTANGYIGKTPGYTKVVNLGKLPSSSGTIATSLWDTSAQPVKSRVEKFERQLSEAGYSSSIRSKMTSGRLGIYIADDVNLSTSTRRGLPTKTDGEGRTTVYTIVYGIPTRD